MNTITNALRVLDTVRRRVERLGPHAVVAQGRTCRYGRLYPCERCIDCLTYRRAQRLLGINPDGPDGAGRDDRTSVTSTASSADAEVRT